MPVIGITSCRKLEDYRQAVLHVGGEVRILESSADVEAALAGIDGLLLTGGNDVAPTRCGETAHATVVEAEPGRDEFELKLVAARARATCRSLPSAAACSC
jgi:putative glutamine amidotransferase